MAVDGRSRLVGRDRELARLDAAVSAAAAGTPLVLLVEGEAGVGKTRLVAEWLQRARAAGATAVAAACVDLGEGLLPYGPVAQLLRLITRQLGEDRMRELVGTPPPELAALLPATLVPSAAAVSPPPGRLFEHLLELLDRVATEAPLALCIDDLHWADSGTVDAVRYLARSLTTERIALVLAYRTEERAVGSALMATRNELLRVPGAQLLAVAPLNSEEVATLLAGLLGEEPDPTLARRLHGRTGGNPYFVEELVHSGAWSAESPPPGLRAVLADRIDALSPDVQALLRLVAVSGRTSSYRELAAAQLLPPLALDDAIRVAVSRQLLVGEGGDWDRVSFRHALVRDVLLAELTPERRRVLHERWAHALEHNEGADPAERARHWDEAGYVERALVARVQAATEAAGMSGYGEAWRHWQRALELWRRTRKGPSLTGLDEVALHEWAAVSARWAGAPDQAASLLEGMLERPEATGDPERAGTLLELLSRCLRDSGRGRESSAAARRAAELLAGAPASPAAARVAAGAAAAYLVQSQYREAVAAAQNAISLAEAVGAPAEAGHAYNTLGVALVMTGGTEPGLAALERAQSVADALGGIEDRLRARNNLSYAYMNSGRYRDALGTALAGFVLAGRHGLAATAGSLLLTNATTALVWLGEWVEADQLARQALDEGGPAGLAAALYLTRAEVAVATGDLAGAHEHLDRAEALAGDLDEPQLFGHLAACRAESLLWRGSPGPAAAIVAGGLASVGVGEDAQLALRLCALGLRGAADRAELARFTRQPAAGDDVADLLATLERLALLPDGAFPEARADAAMAAAEAGRAEAAERSAATDGAAPGGAKGWTDAAQHWSELERPYPRAYCQWRAAEALLAAKAPQVARRVLHEAYDAARALGAGPLLSEIEALARRARIDLAGPAVAARSGPTAGGTPAVPAGPDAAPGPRPATGPDPAPGVGFWPGPGLTPREREVLTLVCDGLTNRQIARRLFISEKTASVHVSRIMTKLNAPTRGAAAAAARRLGLPGDQS